MEITADLIRRTAIAQAIEEQVDRAMWRTAKRKSSLAVWIIQGKTMSQAAQSFDLTPSET